jgi:16S rRNA (adenine1518-N6/adenine1519-N6)-dimethyltransferase
MTRRERLLEKIRLNGTGPKRALGQNFLISDHVIDRILENALETGSTSFWAAAGKANAILEIGPGLGALTDGLIIGTKKLSIPFSVIELDRDFATSWREQGLTVVEADALQVDWKSLEMPQGTRLISNLPYQISSSLVIDRSVDAQGVTSMVLMFQKEVAKRIMAKPKTEDFGLLSVIAQLGWDIEIVCEAGPQDFFPPPRVASRVLRFRRKADAPGEQEFSRVLSFAKRAYAHRRKLLAGNLAGGSANRETIEAVIESMGFTKTARAEELSPVQILELFRRL